MAEPVGQQWPSQLLQCTHCLVRCSFQLSVTVSYQVTVGFAELSLVEKDQSATTKAIR